MQGTPVSDSKMIGVAGGSDPLAKLPPALLREMRESFQTLDRDNDGTVNDADVADMLGQLGMPSDPSLLFTEEHETEIFALVWRDANGDLHRMQVKIPTQPRSDRSSKHLASQHSISPHTSTPSRDLHLPHPTPTSSQPHSLPSISTIPARWTFAN